MLPADRLRDLIPMIDPFPDSAGFFYVHLLRKRPDGGTEQIEMPLDAEPFRNWIKVILFERNGRLPSEGDTRTALDLLRGYASEQPHRVPTNPQCQLPELTPFGKVLVKLAEMGGLREGLSGLGKTIVNLARRHGLWSPDFNRLNNPDVLGGMLAAQVDNLRQHGVALTQHRGDRREWSIEPANFSPMSPARRQETATVHSDFGHADPAHGQAGLGEGVGSVVQETVPTGG